MIFRMSDQITVGYDGSDTASDAVLWAANEAAKRKVGLRIVSCYDIPSMGALTPGWPSGQAIVLVAESAVANAEDRKVIDVDSLYVKHVSVDMGPAIKRFRPRAQGRASQIKKKISHIHVVLDEK